MSEYLQKADEFLKSTGATITTKFIEHGKHFEDDKEPRDIYEVTISKGVRSFKVRFGQSIHHSGKYRLSTYAKNILKVNALHTTEEYQRAKKRGAQLGDPFLKHDIRLNVNFEEPNAYDILACLQKYDVGTFENFCSEFGYDVDSRKAEKVYKAFCEEFANVQKLFTDEEIERLQEIQ